MQRLPTFHDLLLNPKAPINHRLIYMFDNTPSVGTPVKINFSGYGITEFMKGIALLYCRWIAENLPSNSPQSAFDTVLNDLCNRYYNSTGKYPAVTTILYMARSAGLCTTDVEAFLRPHLSDNRKLNNLRAGFSQVFLDLFGTTPAKHNPHASRELIARNHPFMNRPRTKAAKQATAATNAARRQARARIIDGESRTPQSESRSVMAWRERISERLGALDARIQYLATVLERLDNHLYLSTPTKHPSTNTPPYRMGVPEFMKPLIPDYKFSESAPSAPTTPPPIVAAPDRLGTTLDTKA